MRIIADTMRNGGGDRVCRLGIAPLGTLGRFVDAKVRSACHTRPYNEHSVVQLPLTVKFLGEVEFGSFCAQVTTKKFSKTRLGCVCSAVTV